MQLFLLRRSFFRVRWPSSAKTLRKLLLCIRRPFGGFKILIMCSCLGRVFGFRRVQSYGTKKAPATYVGATNYFKNFTSYFKNSCPEIPSKLALILLPDEGRPEPPIFRDSRPALRSKRASARHRNCTQSPSSQAKCSPLGQTE